MSKKLEVAQQRICVEKVKESDAVELFEMRKNPVKSRRFQKLKAAFLTKKLWPRGATIKIFFMENGINTPRTPLYKIKETRDEDGNVLKMDPLQTSLTPEIGTPLTTIEAVKKIVMERVQPIVGLKLEFTNNIAESSIRITFNPMGGAWSLLGTDCKHPQFNGKPTMNLGWLDVATTIHEFGHALGMIHEHQNPDGNLIQWDEPKVFEWARDTQGWDQQTTRHNIIDRYNSDEINGSVFDPKSIMLYFFPASITINNKGTHQNLRLSKKDVKFLNKMYPNSRENPDSFLNKIYGVPLSSSQIVNINNKYNLLIGLALGALLCFLYTKYKNWQESKEDKMISETLQMASKFGL